MSELREPTPDPGTPGASARAEHERRKASRERRARAKHPRIGGLLHAWQDEPQDQKAWARGAAGEEQVAELLAKYLDDDVIVLHWTAALGRIHDDSFSVGPDCPNPHLYVSWSG